VASVRSVADIRSRPVSGFRLTPVPGFGVGTNGFGFIISWATNLSVVVDACTDLANPTGLAVGTNALNEGWSQLSDPEWTTYRSRFYRVWSP
jgi:hypothetical protein